MVIILSLSHTIPLIVANHTLSLWVIYGHHDMGVFPLELNLWTYFTIQRWYPNVLQDGHQRVKMVNKFRMEHGEWRSVTRYHECSRTVYSHVIWFHQEKHMRLRVMHYVYPFWRRDVTLSANHVLMICLKEWNMFQIFSCHLISICF